MRHFVLGAGVLAWVGFVACARVMAPPPPAVAPTAQRDTLLPGHPLVLAGKAARVLQQNQFVTRRFGKDSTWGYASADRMSIRFRYLQVGDSTRVLGQAWGRCDASACVSGDLRSLLLQIAEAEAPPQ